MISKNIIEKFRGIRLFSTLRDDELAQVAHKIRIKQFKKNTIILHEEETNQFMYIILSGKVKVVQTSEEGKEIILAIHQAGDSFGEIALIDNKTAPAEVVTIKDSVVATISKNDFHYLLYTQKKVLEILLQIFCARLRDSWERMQILSFNNASQRLKMLFLLLSEEHGKKECNGITLTIKLTHQEIANMAGMTRETVTRIVDKLNKDGEISILKNKLIHLTSDFIGKDMQYIPAKYLPQGQNRTSRN